MTTSSTEQIPSISASPAELAQIRHRIARRLFVLSALVVFLTLLGPALLEWVIPAGISTSAFIWALIKNTAATISSVEVFISQYSVQIAVFVGFYIIYLSALVVNQTLNCAELIVNTELASIKKFEKAYKGYLILKKSLECLAWTILSAGVLTVVSLVYKILEYPAFEPVRQATVLFVIVPIAALLTMVSPVLSLLIPRTLRQVVDCRDNSHEVRAALSELNDQFWSDGHVSFYSHPGIYFYWLCKQENMLEKFKAVAKAKDVQASTN